MGILADIPIERKRRAWLVEQGLTVREAASRMHLSEPFTHRLLRAEFARPERVADMRSLGFPPELLPEARVIKLGRPAQKREPMSHERRAE